MTLQIKDDVNHLALDRVVARLLNVAHAESELAVVRQYLQQGRDDIILVRAVYQD